MISTYFSLNHK